MIPRYSRPEMTAIWEPATKFRIWYEIEAHACDAQAALGVIPKANAEAVWKAKDVEFDVARIDEIEAVTKHDVIAFSHPSGRDHRAMTRRASSIRGMTSSDVLDTTFNIQLVRATDLLLAGVDRVLAALKTRAMEHRMTVRIGRSHGIHAEPVTMGLTFARFYAEMDRNRNRLEKARWEIATGRDLRRRGDLRQYRSGRRGSCLRETRPAPRADLDPGHSPRPPRDVLRPRWA